MELIEEEVENAIEEHVIITPIMDRQKKYQEKKIKSNGNTFDRKNNVFNDKKLDLDNNVNEYSRFKHSFSLTDPTINIRCKDPEFDVYLNENEKLQLVEPYGHSNISLQFTSLLELKEVALYPFKKDDFLCNKLEILYTSSRDDENDEILDRKQHVCFYLEDINESNKNYFLSQYKILDDKFTEQQLKNQIKLVEGLKKIIIRNNGKPEFMENVKLKYDKKKHLLYALDGTSFREIKLFFDQNNNLTKVDQVSKINISDILKHKNRISPANMHLFVQYSLNYIVTDNKILISNNHNIAILNKNTKKTDEVKEIETSDFQYYLDTTKISKTENGKHLELENLLYSLSRKKIEEQKTNYFNKKVQIIKDIDNQKIEPVKKVKKKCRQKFCQIF